MSLGPLIRWQVADTTARDLLTVGPQDVGFFVKVLSGSGALYQAVQGGTGSACWQSDVTSTLLPKTSFTVPITVHDAVDLIGGNAAVVRWAAPLAGTITLIKAVIDGALTTGNAVLTGKIGSTSITGGAVTCTQAASAAGSVFTATPSAANVLAVGDVLSFTVSGTQDAAKFAKITIAFTPTVA